MRGAELRTGTSRFLVQGAFVVYKLVMAVYFTFWAVYWPRVEGFRKQAVNQLTFWTWDVCAGCECVRRGSIALPVEACRIKPLDVGSTIVVELGGVSVSPERVPM